jgi:hypothetical protein
MASLRLGSLPSAWWKRISPRWDLPASRIPGPRAAVGLPPGGEADGVQLEASLAANTWTPSRGRLPPWRERLPAPRGSGPRRLGSRHHGGYRDLVALSPSPVALGAPLAARKRTSQRWRLLPLRIPGHRAVVGSPPDAGSLPRRREADALPLDPPLAADTGTASRRRLPRRRGKLPPARGAKPRAEAGSNGRDRAPQPRAKTAPNTASPERATAGR